MAGPPLEISGVDEDGTSAPRMFASMFSTRVSVVDDIEIYTRKHKKY
jgi:hypothetical protein